MSANMKENLIVVICTVAVGAIIIGGSIGVAFMCGRYMGMF